MKKYAITELSKNVFYVGVKDWNRRIFDALIPLPQGTSYNSYLVKGNEKTALIDTVNPGFESELAGRINEVHDPAGIDYIVMNHAEPDHAGAIPFLMKSSSKAMLLTSEKGAKLAQVYYQVPVERIKIVKDGESINLGGKTLQSISAPFLHWPETIFTYLEEDRILFPCDFFGAHTSLGIFDDDVEDILHIAKSYFGEIMMPFKNMGEKALEKIKPLKIEMIAPSHGPIYKNPEKILGPYRLWTAGTTREKVIVAYASMWGSIEAMSKTMVDALRSGGVEVSVFNLANMDLGDVARELVDSRAIVLGMPTVIGGLHPLALHAANVVKALRPPLKYAAVLNSYGWSPGAVKQAADFFGSLKIDVVGSIEINGPPTANDHEKIIELGRQLSSKVKGT